MYLQMALAVSGKKKGHVTENHIE